MNRLYKSNKDKIFDGVCGGIGEYFAIDPVIVRLLWVILVIFGGTGVLAYLVAMLIIPKNPEQLEPDEISQSKEVTGPISQRFWGILLIIAGLFLLIGLIGPIGGLFAGVGMIMGHFFWPLLIILLGFYLFFNQSSNKDIKSSIDEAFPPGQKLYTSQSDRRIAGVCGGIGEYFGTDANIIRIFWVMATLGSFGFGILAYFLLAVFLPDAE